MTTFREKNLLIFSVVKFTYSDDLLIMCYRCYSNLSVLNYSVFQVLKSIFWGGSNQLYLALCLGVIFFNIQGTG